ncbi:hypothetical protein AVEN_74811-1 [Araneus ventricosus]|uniref:Speckle-type POZ protein n=1 Tax=Araneus ventricosus TaxID=182803 RepID=A0A4Y2HNW3_ARAVE|nr:hypothetical protein AVEN_74811-1 [Araneus ventricosus]
MNDGRKECTFLWFIEKYSYCWHEKGELLTSPRFSFDALEGTVWNLVLFPRGCRNEERGNISLFLYRSANDAGPEYFPVKYELSLLAADRSALHSRDSQFTFKRNDFSGYNQLVQMDEIHLQKKAEYLPNDTLSVCCKMWKGERDWQTAEQISARTRIVVEKIWVIHIVENFSTLQPNVKKTRKIQSNVEGDLVILNLYYTDDSCDEEKIIIEIVPSDAKKILHKCKFSLLEKYGIIRDCGGIDYAFDAERLSIHKLPLSFTREAVLKKSEYLTNDMFFLLCECTFSTKITLHTIEEHRHELPLAVIKQKRKHDDNKDLYKAAEKISECCSVSEDIKAIYINQQLTDMELRTKTKSFPAHKVVLCVRSPVFEAMLTSDMKETNTACIPVDDLEDDTVEQLLLFLYSDSLERL